jgi:multicomponent Na+:H+ antiporter subunit F
MTAVVTVVLGVLAVSGLLAVVALIRGPSAADRMVALDLLLLVLAGATAAGAVAADDGTLLVVLVVVTLIAFVGTVAVARIIELRGEAE